MSPFVCSKQHAYEKYPTYVLTLASSDQQPTFTHPYLRSRLSQVYGALLQSENVAVRQALAHSLHEVARLLGRSELVEVGAL